MEKLIATDLPRLGDGSLLFASKMKNLVNLCVTAHEKLNGAGMKQFVGNKRIKYLTFESPEHLSLEALSFIQALPAIEELYFNKGKIAVAQLEQLSGMQNLRKLRYEVEDAEQANERLISILKTFPKLR